MSNTPKYRQAQFDAKLIEMLKEAKEGKRSNRIKASDLLKQVAPGEPYMRMACRALQKLLFSPSQRSKALTYEVEFNTADLPE